MPKRQPKYWKYANLKNFKMRKLKELKKKKNDLDKAESSLRFEKFEEAEKGLMAETERLKLNLAKISPKTTFFKEVFELLEDFHRAMSTTRRNSKVTYENVDVLKKRITSLENSNDKLVVKMDLVLKMVIYIYRKNIVVFFYNFIALWC